jgi:hypothetical protein
VVPPTIQGRYLAKVGHEKEAAFHFLKDAEEATAFGTNWLGDVEDPELPPKLPHHLALRRCNHFGDTMFFIDRLTQISLDLKAIPVIHRTVRKFLPFHVVSAVSFPYALTDYRDYVTFYLFKNDRPYFGIT